MTPQAQQIIDKYSDYFISSSFIGDILRWIGWKICIGLKVFCDLIQQLFDSAYQLVAFTNDNIFKTFLGDFYPLATVILTISFIILGLTYMFSEKRPDILKNALIGMAVIFIGPQLTGALNDTLITGKNAMVGNTTVSSQAISSNVKDLKYIAANSFNFNLNVSESTANNLMYISMDEHVKPDSVSGDLQKKVFSYIKQISDSGTVEYKEVGKKGTFDVFDPPYYYRYSYHFLQIVLVLLANIIILLFSTYAVVRMIWEILTTRILASIFSMEITSGQKVKKSIEAFIHSYIVLFLIAVNIKLFQLAQQFVNNKFPNWEQGLIRAILIVFIALVVIDGPRFIEQLLGYDLGMSHGAQKLFGLMRIVQQSQMQHKMSQNAKAQQERSKSDNQRMENKSTVGSGRNNEPNINQSDSGSNNEPNMAGEGNNTSNSYSGSEPNVTNESGNRFSSGTQNSTENGGGSNVDSDNTNSSNNSTTAAANTDNISSKSEGDIISNSIEAAEPNSVQNDNSESIIEPDGSTNKIGNAVDNPSPEIKADNPSKEVKADNLSNNISEPGKDLSADNKINAPEVSKEIEKSATVQNQKSEKSGNSTVNNSSSGDKNSAENNNNSSKVSADKTVQRNDSINSPQLSNKQYSTKSTKSRKKED